MTSELDILKLLQHCGEETELADFTPEELQALLEEMLDEAPMSLTKEGFKEKYFAFYDDVKDKSLKKQDWKFLLRGPCATDLSGKGRAPVGRRKEKRFAFFQNFLFFSQFFLELYSILEKNVV